MEPDKNQPDSIGAGDIDGFVRERLENPQREAPLVVISVARGSRSYLVPPTRIAEQMGDLAQVVRLEDEDAGWELSKRVGGRLSCYWGAVRLYWPGFDSGKSRAYEHPVWLSQRIRAAGPNDVIDEIAEIISERTSEAVVPRIDEVEAALQEERRRREAAEREVAEERRKRTTDEERLQEQVSRIGEVEGERDAATNRADAAEREREEAEEARDAANARITGLEHERDELRERLKSGDGEDAANLTEIEEERDRERERANTAEENLKTARERLRKDHANFDRERKDLEKKREKAVADLDNKRKEVEERLNGRIEKAIERETAAKQERDGERENVKQLQEEVDGLKLLPSGAESTATEQESLEKAELDQEYLQDISELQVKNMWLDRRVKQLEQEIERSSQPDAPNPPPIPTPSSSGNVSFSFLHEVKGFSIEDCDHNDIRALTKNLAQRSKMTWQQLKAAPHTGAGTEKIDREQIKVAIPQDVPEDKALLALRFGRKFRVVGYREDDAFVVVWVDPKHKVY